MVTADHGPAVSGAHNTIVTARAGGAANEVGTLGLQAVRRVDSRPERRASFPHSSLATSKDTFVGLVQRRYGNPLLGLGLLEARP